MRIFFFLSLLGVNSFLSAQNNTDTIRAGKFDMKYLPDGTQQWLVYIKKDGVKKNIWLWERTTTKENWNGTNAIVIRQQWTTSDTGFNSRQLLSVVNEKDFTPVYHTTNNPKTGKEAYNFHAAEIVTADSVAGTGRKDFKMAITEPSFNWEIDLETFPLLPLKEGKTFVVNFYHPGSKSGPAWYNYTVTGSEKIKTNSGEVDCYKLYTEYSNNRGNSTWWLNKKTHEVLKMEEHFGTVTRYKLKLAVTE
ncbi:MAG TPA: hypothetical protein VGO58_02900 [Chitinophagaceae bacterium]|jgi:hypothetical protein|nr:hypothetical protein [Chitinophagaceae bacterium]